MTCIMTIFYFMSVITIISDFSFQIPTTEKSIKLVYVLSVLSKIVTYFFILKRFQDIALICLLNTFWLPLACIK